MKQVKFVTLTTEPATVYSNDLILLSYSDETEKNTVAKNGFTFMKQYDKFIELVPESDFSSYM